MPPISLQKFYSISLICSIAIALIYYPGLNGGFILDDFSNILHQSAITIKDLSWHSLTQAALSMDNRPIARATFGINYYFRGFDPFSFKTVNLLIHIFNTLLVFLFTRLILQHHFQVKKYISAFTPTSISLAIALAWALHPVNLTNVLYVVQRMNSLSALFLLIGMVCYTKARLSLDNSPAKAWGLIGASIIIFLPLAWLSKENGALLTLFLFIIELTIFKFTSVQKCQKNALILLFVFILLLPAVFAVFYIFQHPGSFLAGYGNRYFSLSERLLTEPRVIWLYIQMILLPTHHVFGIFLDDIPLSRSITDPPSTLVAIIGLLALLSLALASIKRAPILAFGLLFFFTGHLMESTFIPLEIAFEHRNYLPSIGLLMPLFYYLGVGIPSLNKKLRFSLIIILITFYALLTHARAWAWSDNIRLYLTEVQNHPASARANYEAGKIYGQRLEQDQGDPESNYGEAIKHFERVTELREDTTSGLFGSILAAKDSGHTIKPFWVNQLEYRLANRPLEQVNIMWLNKMADCVSQNKCNINELPVNRLLDAAISSPYASNRYKSLLYAIKAKFSFQVDTNKEKAIVMAKKAVSLQPSNLYHQINLIKYLISAGKIFQANKALESVEKNDFYKQHSSEISKLKIFLKNKQQLH